MKYVENLFNVMRFKKTTNIDIINISESKKW